MLDLVMRHEFAKQRGLVAERVAHDKIEHGPSSRVGREHWCIGKRCAISIAPVVRSLEIAIRLRGELD